MSKRATVKLLVTYSADNGLERESKRKWEKLCLFNFFLSLKYRAIVKECSNLKSVTRKVKNVYGHKFSIKILRKAPRFIFSLIVWV